MKTLSQTNIGRLILGTTVALALPAAAIAAQPITTFTMVPSSASCLPNAKAQVVVNSLGAVETMTVTASGLRPNTDYDLFVIQVPTAPFGISWYQGDMESDAYGRAVGTFVGRFSRETFVVAPGTGAAPSVHGAKDAATNPATAPVHTFHLGLWFNSPTDAVAAGCPGATTPFNGAHNAGVQVLNTSNFSATFGPLARVFP